MTDPLEPNDLSHMTDENFNALCPQGEHAPGPEPLSSTAKAVMIAATNGNTNVVNDPVYKQCVAAALRVVAHESALPVRRGLIRVEDVLAIATELEGADA